MMLLSKKMKKLVMILTIAGLLATFGIVFGPAAVWIYQIHQQMKAGSAVLDSLNEPELQRWLDRTEILWREFEGQYGMGVYQVGSRPLPADLEALRMIRVDVDADFVRYVWMGGMDHCSLTVERKPDGYAYFTAEYSDKKTKELQRLKRSEQ